MTTENQENQVQNDKQLRSDYRALLEKARHNKHNLISGEGKELIDLVKDADELQKKVSKPRELAVDSEIFALVTEAGKELTNKLARGGKNYTPADFIRRLKAHYVYDTDAQERGQYDPSAFDWAAVGRTVALFFRPAPVVFHMLGPMDARPKEKRQVVRQKRKAQVGEAVRPEELTDIGDSEKQETDKNMEEMWEVLKAHGDKADLLELVLNPRSFAQTVENLFTLSFLVRDQKVALHTRESGIEVEVRQKQPKAQAKPESEKERVQFVVELDIDTWEGWKAVVEPQRCLMRDRPDTHHDDIQQEQQLMQQTQQTQQQQQQQQQEEEGWAGQQRWQQEIEEEEDEEQEEEQPRSKPKRSKRR